MLVAGRIKNFKDYSKFSSIKEFNNIEMFLAEHKKNFTKGEIVVALLMSKGYFFDEFDLFNLFSYFPSKSS
ncbi:hypothetical protein [uncultured Psychrobacillus sp.]|uniref:hypothetical protein n=1 Tax=uncultured Psychrobacillus sp. TaxID=1551585 RepID=UPI002608A44C|nr:hypothetical protein [uncultured Psychrobacillus sp.]